MHPFLTHFIPKSASSSPRAQVWPTHIYLPSSTLQSHYLDLNKDFFFFFFHSSSLSLILVFPIVPLNSNLLQPAMDKAWYFHTPPPNHTYQLTNATSHPMGHRHLLTVLVTIPKQGKLLSGFAFLQGRRHVTLLQNTFHNKSFIHGPKQCWVSCIFPEVN